MVPNKISKYLNFYFTKSNVDVLFIDYIGICLCRWIYVCIRCTILSLEEKGYKNQTGRLSKGHTSEIVAARII